MAVTAHKASSRSLKTKQPAYSVETVSRQVAITTDSGDRIILTDPDITAFEFPSWGTIVDYGKKIADIISGPTFPDGGDSGGGDTTITITITVNGDGTTINL